MCPYATGAQYSSQYNAMVCFKCAINCESCSNSTVCYQCKDNYQIDSTFSCVLKPNYFINSSGEYLCSDKFANCDTCVSDGTSCVICVSGYAINIGSCFDCTTIDPNCIECTTQMCLACKPTYELLTAALCYHKNSTAIS